MRRPTQYMAALRLAMPPNERSRQEASHLFGNGPMICSILIAFTSLGAAASAQTVVDAATPPETQSAGLAGSQSQASVEDVLTLLPADTLAVVVARSLKELDERSAALLKRLDLPTHPAMPVLATLGVMTGVDASRAAGVAILATETKTPLPDGLVLLLPTTNTAALIVMLQPEPVEDGFWRVSIRGRESFVGARDGYTVFGASLVMVKRVVRGGSSLAPRLSTRQRERLLADDLFAWFDSSIRTRVRGAGALGAWMQQALGVGAESLDLYADGCASARFDPKGIRLRFLLRPRSAEPVGDDSAALSAPAIAWPGEPLAVAVEVANGTGGGRGRLLLKWVTRRLLDGAYIDSTRVSELSAAFLTVADSVDVSSLQVALSPGGRMAATLMLHAKRGVKAPLESIQRLVETLAGDVFVDPKVRLALQRLKYVPAAETVAEIPVDHVTLDVTGLTSVDTEAVRAVFGSEGLLARVGAIDGNPTVITLGGGSARFARAVAAVRSMRPALTLDSQRDTSSLFLKARISVDQWLALWHAISLVTGTGGDAPEIPVLSAPVTLTMGLTSGGETDVDLFLPADVIAAARGGLFWNRSVSPGGGN